jgi:hypothetical protein
MYNKIFAKILDSSVWLEPTPTRIVWITLLAAMDENGFCSFAAVGNIAGRARVTLDEAKSALQILEAPDVESSDPTNDGRRIERVPGGWIVLNATKYREIVTRVNAQEKTNERVKRFRDNKKLCNALVTPEQRSVNATATTSEAYTDTNTEKHLSDPNHKVKPMLSVEEQIIKIYEAYPRKAGRGAALKAIKKATVRLVTGDVIHKPMDALKARGFLWKKATEYANSPIGRKPPDGEDFRPHPATWFNQERYFDDVSEWQRDRNAPSKKPDPMTNMKFINGGGK